MSRFFYDAAIEVITIAWFGWLLSWPFVVAANIIGWGCAASISYRRGSHSAAWWCTALMIVVLADGFLVMSGYVFEFLAAVPSNWRLLVQLVLIVVPFCVSVAGLLWLAFYLWRAPGRQPQPVAPVDA